jgi:pre-rRNA-processing protein TSR2
MDEFRAGVTAALRSWSALRTAAESGWGGVDSIQKAEDLRSNIFQHFDGSSVPPKAMTDVMDLEDLLVIYMEEEFSVVLEDNSERQVADVIWRMYHECSKGDFVLASQIVASAQKVAAQAQSYPVQVLSSEQDDDEDDEMDTGDEAATLVLLEPVPPETVLPALPSAVEYAAQPLFGHPKKRQIDCASKPQRQLGETTSSPAETLQLDEDGFAPVIKSKRKGQPKPV